MLINIYILAGFLATQRFLLSAIYHFSPIISLIFAAIWAKRSAKQAGVYVILALFTTSDLGGEIYNVTNPALRYTSYLAAIGLLLSLTTFRLENRNAAKMVALIILVLITSGIYSLEASHLWGGATIIRDLLILLCICACLFEGRAGKFDLQPLYFCSLGFLAGELFNLLIFFERATYSYMSFTSLKVFVVFPIFYRIYVDKKMSPFCILLVVPVLLVLLAYNSKMLIVSFLFTALLMSLSALYERPALVWRALSVTSALFLLLQTTLILYSDVEGSRVLQFFFSLREGQGFLATINYLEPVRLHQHYLFFSRDILEIIFGNGIGAGINDTFGQLSFVANETAFTAQEMRESRYFNFHDIWIDFGLRFGLITLAFFVFYLLRLIINPDTRALGAMFMMILINATFSISGILIAVLFYKVALQQSAKGKSEKLFIGPDKRINSH